MGCNYLFKHVSIMWTSGVEWYSDYGNERRVSDKGKRLNVWWTALAIHGAVLVIETGEVIYNIITDHSKTARSVTHRHTIACAHQIQQNIFNILPLNAPQPEQMTWLTIEAHISSSRVHILTLLNRIDTTLLYYRIPNGITPHTYLFPLQRWHIRSSIRIHAHTSCGYPSYQ